MQKIKIFLNSPKYISNVYFAYTCLFSVIFLIGFYPFWINGRSFVWQTDGVASWYPTLLYSGKFFREIVRNILELDFSIAFFDFRIGLGHDILQSGHTPQFDLLNMLSVFVPARYTEELLNFITIARFYISGLAFIHFCKYMCSDNYSALIGALAYVFGGWMLFTGPRHPFFMQATIYTPLIIEGLDRILSNKKPFMFVAFTFLFALTGYYFLYMVFLFFAPYVLIRLNFLYPGEYVKMLKIASYSVVCTLIVIFMSSIHLLPSILFFLGGSRVPTLNVSNLWIGDLNWYRDFSMRLIGGYANWGHLLFPAIVMISFVWLVFDQNVETRRERLHMLSLLIVLVLIRLIPAGGLLFNGFGYVSPRWMFLFAFFTAFIIVKSLPEIISLNDRIFYISIFITMVYGSLVVTISRYRTIYFFLGFAMLAITLALLTFSSNIKPHLNIKKCCLMIIIVINLSTNAVFWYHTDLGGYSNQFVLSGVATSRHPNIPEIIRPREDSFHRVDIIGGQQNTSFIHDYFGIISYLSVTNANIMSFLSSMEAANALAFRIRDWDNRTIINTITSVKYLASQSSVNRLPHGFFEYTFEEGWYIFRNRYFLPLGFTYQQAIYEKAFNELDPVSRQEIMLTHLVIDNYISSQEIPQLSTERIPFEIIEKNDLSWDDGVLIVNRANASMTITFTGLPNSETFVRLMGLSNDSRNRASITKAGDLVSVNKEASFWRDNFHSPAHAYYYTTNLGYSYYPQFQITITFAHTGVYDLADIQIFALPMDNFATHIEALRAETMTNIDLHDRGLPGLTNRVTGEITVSGNRYLFLSIPYSRGWRAYVNGEPTPILRANTAFMALELEEGHHYIDLRYRTPGLRAGMGLSVLGFGGFIFLLKFHDRIIAKLNPPKDS